MAEPARTQPILRTVDAFLDWAETQDEDWEFFDGALRMMSPPGVEHNAIVTNLGGLLHARLRGGPCRPHIGGTGLRTENRLLRPDLAVTCRPESGRDLRHPVVLVEVLAPATEAEDLGRKWRLYRALPSLRHYLVLRQDGIAGDLFTRAAEGRWTLTPLEGPQARLALDAIGVELPLGEIYEGVTFAADEPSDA